MKNTGNITNTQKYWVQMWKSYKQRYWYHLCIECNCVENDETVNISWLVKDVLAMCWLLTVWLFWNVVNRKSQANITQGLKVQADRPPFFMITKIKPFEIKEKKIVCRFLSLPHLSSCLSTNVQNFRPIEIFVQLLQSRTKWWSGVPQK